MRLLAAGTAALAVMTLVGLAWMWYNDVPLRSVEVLGVVHADSSEVVRYAALEVDSVRLFAVEPTILVDRVRRTPWVRDAVVRRRPSGTLRIRVEEREPVVLLVDGQGRPARFLDGQGYAMPLTEGAVFDVPLLRGAVPPASSTAPVDSAPLRELLAALSDIDRETDALISEVLVARSGDVSVKTSPGGGHGSITVRLGTEGFGEKLARLRAFWRQAVLTRPEMRFQAIDLRFDGQIVSREDSTLSPSNTPNPKRHE